MPVCGSSEPDDVVDKTRKIDIDNVNIDLDAGRLGKKVDALRGEGTGGALGDVAPWTEPASPLTPPPSISKRGGGFGFSKISRSLLRQDNDSTLYLPNPQPLRKFKSYLSLVRPSSPPIPSSSESTPKSFMLPSLLRRKSYKRLRAKTLENEEHPSLRARTPPLPELPVYPPTRQKKEKESKYESKGRKDASGTGPSSMPQNGEDVVMKLDTNLDQMEGIVDPTIVANGAFSVSASIKGGSSIHTHQSMSDDGKHSSHHFHSRSNASSSMMMPRTELNYLGQIPHSDFHNPFSQSSSSNSTSPDYSYPHSNPSPYTSPSSLSLSAPRISSLANPIRDRKISPRAGDALLPPTSTNGLHHDALTADSSHSQLEIGPSDPSWAPPESWSTQLGDQPNPEVEDDSYYSSGEDSLLSYDGATARSGSGSGMEPGDRGTVGGGQSLEFARLRSNFDDDGDESELATRPLIGISGVDEHGRRASIASSTYASDDHNLRTLPNVSLASSALAAALSHRKSSPSLLPSVKQQLPSLPSHSLYSQSQDSRQHQDARYKKVGQDPPSRFSIRVYRADNTYYVVSCGFNVTVATLTLKLNAKLLLGEERGGHNLYLKERGRERILGNTERPADIVRRRLEQAGYDLADGFDLLTGDSLSFLLKFSYKSQAFGPAEQNLNIKDYERIDLSGRSLRTIPVALHQHADQIVSLYLSRNPMLDLPLDFIQSCISLTELRLSQMGHKRIPVNVSAALSLTRLDISSNRIGDLDDAYLERILGLRTLYAQNNRMEKLPRHFPRLRVLTTLNISNNKFRVLPAVVCQLESLRDLDISFNSISHLPEDLGLLRNLEHLIMVGNQISRIPPEATGLVSLRRFDCRRNLIVDLTVITMLPKLEKLRADHNTLHVLDLCSGPFLTTIEASFNEITQIELMPGPVGRPPSSLISLDVSHTKLSSLDSLALNELVSLRNLNLSYNRFKLLPSSLGNLDYLETLSCSNNVLEELPESIGKLKRLRVLDVHKNNLMELPEELWNCPSLIKLNATSNLIEKWAFPLVLPVGGVGLVNDDFYMHRFSSSSSSIRLPDLAYALERLYLGENQLTSDTLQSFLPLFQELEVLNLSFNSIQDLPPTFFKSLSPSQKSNLKELYLSGNGLTTLPTEDLVKMTRLDTLYLNGNRLQSLPQELGKVQSLTVLDVGSNSLKYNIYNWEFDWNWNFNKNLKYLNLSGNKRLQIKSDHTKLPSGSCRRFTDLTQLRVLGLMDITITSTGMSVDIPDENEDRRVRTSGSTVCGMAYGIADTLGRNDHLNMVDLVHELISTQDHRKNEAIFAIFGGSQPHKATPGVGGNRIAKFLRDKFVEVFCAQLAGLKEARAEGVPDALRRSFLKLNQNLHNMLFTNRKYSAFNGSGTFLGPVMHDAVFSRGGASGVVLYFRGKTMYIANAGNALAIVSRDGHAELVSRKHDPYDQLETSRIRAAEGWISPAGLVNDEIDISRSFGFFHLLPIVNARPDITTWELSELDEFVIVADRGLWDFVSYKAAVDIAHRERGNPMLAAQKLRDFAMSYGADGSIMIMVISVADLFRTDESKSMEGSIVNPSVMSQIQQLGLVCLQLESLAMSPIFQEMGEQKSSIQMVSNDDNDKEEALFNVYGAPNFLLPPLDEKMLSDWDMMLMLDTLSRRIENAVCTLWLPGGIENVVHTTRAVLDQHGQTQAHLTCSRSGVWSVNLANDSNAIVVFTVDFNDPSFPDVLADVLADPWNHPDWSKPYHLNILLELLHLEARLSVVDDFKFKLFRYTCNIAQKIELLPSSLYLWDLTKEGDHPVCGGGYADIWRGQLASRGPVCLKVLRFFTAPEPSRSKLFKEVSQEVLVWSQLNHPNVLPFLGVNTDLFPQNYCLVSPWCSYGSIMNFLIAHPDADKMEIIYDILCGLKYLHTRRPPVVHGDLKGANILMSNSKKCCLADFGLASITSTLQTLSSSTGSPRGSVRWMAPELLDYKVVARPSKPTDMYAFGCTIFEIVTGAPPFSNLKRDIEVSCAVLEKIRPTRPEDGFSNELWTAVMNLWAHSAQDRLTAQTFMNSL
ncbi:hypothetical protein BT96DRAFT_978933 [Gymnopus androsaceus JB14]|uniref:adenylate cyclase n=1 Tax=Gymnopus androsaceus JB14 TaxID=1447944 RepID=A0A6A4H830_9AGAR|nr:hypothetical protein BT96DRAFT_978933 [Gymnopus androsaceus JB14]